MQLGDFIINNWPLFLALIIILLLLARSYFGSGAVSNIRPAEAVLMLNREGAVVVDVRTDKEYQEGHIMNSLHIPLGLFENRLSELAEYKSTPIIVACRTGSRSSTAASTLKKQGFELVKNLSGGMLAWTSASLPVTKEKTRTKKKPSLESKPVQKPRVIGHDEKNEVLVYTTRRCPFCTRAIDLLESKNVGYTEIRIDNKPDLRKEMEERAQRKTVPQIFVGDVHIGGCDDMYKLEDEGKLDELLGLTTRD
ncbi:glutaredoxin 3 [Kaarinaea lacus]